MRTTIDTPIVFGTSCLGNLYLEIPMETKTAIALACASSAADGAAWHMVWQL